MWSLFLSHEHTADQEAVTCILASMSFLVAHLEDIGCFPLQKAIVLRQGECLEAWAPLKYEAP